MVCWLSKLNKGGACVCERENERTLAYVIEQHFTESVVCLLLQTCLFRSAVNRFQRKSKVCSSDKLCQIHDLKF